MPTITAAAARREIKRRSNGSTHAGWSKRGPAHRETNARLAELVAGVVVEASTPVVTNNAVMGFVDTTTTAPTFPATIAPERILPPSVRARANRAFTRAAKAEMAKVFAGQEGHPRTAGQAEYLRVANTYLALLVK